MVRYQYVRRIRKPKRILIVSHATSSLPGSALTVGYNYGLPLSHLLLARQLEGLTTLRKRSVLFDEKLKKTRLAIDYTLAVAFPILGILLHLTQQVSTP